MNTNDNAIDNTTDTSAFDSLETNMDSQESTKPVVEERLELLLIRSIFIARTVAVVVLILLSVISIYYWWKNQSQNSWMMTRDFVSPGSVLCRWINNWADKDIRKDDLFREYLIEQNEQELVDLVSNNRCFSRDNLVKWFEIEKKFNLEELQTAYRDVLPKKFLWKTIGTTPELKIINTHALNNRMQFHTIFFILDQAIKNTNSGDTFASCSRIAFSELSVQVTCSIETRPPIQPRSKALDLINKISETEGMLVTYPTGLDLTEDKKNGLLKTNFTYDITYTPSRYEEDILNKYDHES